jgi:exosortase
MPTSTTQSPLHGVVNWKSTSTITAILLALGFIYLIVFLPYAAGYGDYRMTLAQWLGIFWRNATWQHGALAPCIAGFLIWRQRRQLAALPAKPCDAALVVVLLGLLAYWIGYRGNFYYIGYASIQLLVGAVVLWIWGWPHFKAVSFAWIILGFAWPYLFLEDTLAFQLRYLMVTVTHAILNLIGVDTLQDGTRLLSAPSGDIPAGQAFDLNVDGPCSGLRSLFALMMVSALFGYFRQRSWWRRSLLFMLSVPLAVTANMVRILILVFGSMIFGQNFAVGRGEEYTSNFHLIAGIFVFIVGLGGLLVAETLLNKWFGKEKPLKLMQP